MPSKNRKTEKFLKGDRREGRHATIWQSQDRIVRTCGPAGKGFVTGSYPKHNPPSSKLGEHR